MFRQSNKGGVHEWWTTCAVSLSDINKQAFSIKAQGQPWTGCRPSVRPEAGRPENIACDMRIYTAHVTTLAEPHVSYEAGQQLLVYAAVHCLGEGSSGSEPLCQLQQLCLESCTTAAGKYLVQRMLQPRVALACCAGKRDVGCYVCATGGLTPYCRRDSSMLPENSKVVCSRHGELKLRPSGAQHAAA